MNDIKLKLDKRVVEGKKVEKIRQEGLVPSVVYGADTEPINTQSKIVETAKVANEVGLHTPVTLDINGSDKLAIIKSIDFDPVKRTIRHIAFHTIKQTDTITTEVPIVLLGKGDSPAEKAGLVVLQAIDSIEVKAKPANLPESIEVSIEKLKTDEDKVTIADIQLPEGVKFADVDQDMELVIANVYEPSALQADNEAAAGEATDVSQVESEKGGATEEASDAAEKKTEK